MRLILLLLAALFFAPGALAQDTPDDQAVIETALVDMGGYFRSAERYRMLPGTNVGITLHGPTYAYVSNNGSIVPLCIMTDVHLMYAPRENANSQAAPGQALAVLRQSQAYRLAFSEPGRETASQEVANAACQDHPTDQGWFSVSGIQESSSDTIRAAANAALRVTRALTAGADTVDDLPISALGGSEQALSALRREAIGRLARLEFSSCDNTDAFWCNVVKVRFGECGNVTELTLTLHTARPRGMARITQGSVRTLSCMV